MASESATKLEDKNQERRRQQLRRRAILTLSLIAEPLKLQWDEAFLDVAWSAWREALDTRDESGRTGSEADGVPRDVRYFSVQQQQAALRTKFERYGVRCMSTSQLAMLLQQVASDVPPSEAESLAGFAPQQPEGSISVDVFLHWIFDVPQEQLGNSRLQNVMSRRGSLLDEGSHSARLPRTPRNVSMQEPQQMQKQLLCKSPFQREAGDRTLPTQSTSAASSPAPEEKPFHEEEGVLQQKPALPPSGG